MKIAVIGAGAMGSMLGVYLKKGGADVVLSVRRKEVADVMISPGLALKMYEGDGGEIGPLPMNAVTDLSGVGIVDAILLMVKGPNTKTAMEGAMCLVDKNTKVITLQNGIGNTDIIKEFVSEDKIYYGCLNMSAAMDKNGVITGGLFGDNNIFVGSLVKGKEQKKFGEEFCSIFNAAGVSACYTDEIDKEVWYKLILNVAVNATCGLIRLRGGEASEDQQFMLLAVDMVKEAIAVANAMGVDIDFGYFMTQIMPVAKNTSGKHYPSMAQDMMISKVKTEIEFINGAVERLGANVGVPTPINTTVSRLVRVIENNYDRQYMPKATSGASSFRIEITDKFCKGCGFCVKYCPKNVIGFNEELNKKGYSTAKVVNKNACIGCLSCTAVCPEAAINIVKE